MPKNLLYQSSSDQITSVDERQRWRRQRDSHATGEHPAQTEGGGRPDP
jgi:hypothetical protein